MPDLEDLHEAMTEYDEALRQAIEKAEILMKAAKEVDDGSLSGIGGMIGAIRAYPLGSMRAYLSDDNQCGSVVDLYKRIEASEDNS